MKSPYPTPHIDAKPGDFGKTVLMPGDPLRARFMAQTFLQDAVLVNNVRGVQGYTGYYNNVRVSVMASGMGMPSMGIYSYELFHIFGVENILRVGSAGALSPAVRVRDIVLGQGASTNSAYAKQFGVPGTLAPLASYSLLSTCASIAATMPLTYHVGNLLSSDTFYEEEAPHLPPEQQANARWAAMGILAVEMEAAALYLNAAHAGKRALAICTVSDHILTGEATTAQERETSFTAMMELALKTAVAVE